MYIHTKAMLISHIDSKVSASMLIGTAVGFVVTVLCT